MLWDCAGAFLGQRENSRGGLEANGLLWRMLGKWAGSRSRARDITAGLTRNRSRVFSGFKAEC